MRDLIWTSSPDVLNLLTGRLVARFLCTTFYRFLARFSGRRRDSITSSSARMPISFTIILLLLSTILNIGDACSSRSTPKPRPPAPTPRPNVTFNTYTCPPDYATWYCLNGARCFTVKIGDSLLYNCECADGYMGPRCEYKDLDGSYLPSRQRIMLETASIAGGATIAVFMVVIVCLAAYIHFQRKQKVLRASQDTVDGPTVSQRDLERRPFGGHHHHTIPMIPIIPVNVHTLNHSDTSQAQNEFTSLFSVRQTKSTS